MNYNSSVIILKNIDYKDADKLVTIFSEREGKHTVIARGVKKSNSSLRACVQPFCHSLLSFHKRTELDLVTQGKLLNFYGGIRENLELTLHAVYLMELLDKSLLDRLAMPGLFQKVLKILDCMQSWGPTLMLIRYFEINLLAELGYQPHLDSCCQCGNPGRITGFSAVGGGVLCQSCMDSERSGHKISGESLALLRMLSSAPVDLLKKVKSTDAAGTEIENILELYLGYQLETKFQSPGALKRLKRFLKKP